MSEIRVGGGSYLDFDLVPGVAVRGAYAGFGAPDPDLRDLQVFETTVDGSVRGADAGVLDGFTLRSDSFVPALYVRSDEIIDCNIVGGETGVVCFFGAPRFIRCHFRGGSEHSFEGDGGAVFVECSFAGTGPATLETGDYEFIHCRFTACPGTAVEALSRSIVVMRDCTVDACGTDGFSRALRFDGDSALIEGGEFTENLAGVIEARHGALTVRGATFANNYYDDPTGGAGGAAMWLLAANPMIVERCRFERNQTPRLRGGAIYAFQHTTITVRDSLFQENRAAGAGAVAANGGVIERCRFLVNQGYTGPGALSCGINGRMTLADCDFEDNGAKYGGAVSGDFIAAERCDFARNFAVDYGGALFGGSQIFQLTTWTACTFVDNRAGRYGGALYLSGEGLWEDCLFAGNETAEGGGGVYVLTGSPQFVRSAFHDNRAHVGGAIATLEYGSPLIQTCAFDSNHAFLDGGAVHLEGAFAIESCLLYANSADRSGGALCSVLGDGRSPRRLHASTLTGNVAEEAGGGVFVGDDVAITVENSILWGNATFGGGMGEAAQITVGTNVQLAINYNCVQNWTGNLGGTGNIGDDPRFVDAGANDYHLAGDSPCVDAGDPAYVGPGDERDIDDQRRIWHGRIDMGGDEFGVFAEGDLNCDGVIDAFDIEAFILALVDPAGYAMAYPDCDPIIADINLDGVVDAFDIDPFIALLIGG